MPLIESGWLDDYGNPILIDDATGEIPPPDVYGANVPPVIIDPNNPLYQDYGSPGSGVSYIVRQGKPTAQYVDVAPEIIAPGSALNPLKLIADAAGRYFQYKPATVNGQLVYQRAAYAAGAGAGLSPMMLAAIGLIGFVALSGDQRKGK